MSDIKPCPFCGGKAEIRFGGPYSIVRCSGCGVKTDPFISDEDAIDAWNTRAERTCHWEWSEFGNEPDTWEGWNCSICGDMGDELSEIPDYCPSCGAKVMGR